MIFFTFKDSKKISDLTRIQPILGMILFDMLNYCQNNSLPFVVTSVIRTLEENAKLKSTSLTHVEGRAFDLSIRGWDIFKIDEFCLHFNEKYANFAKPLALFHEGNAPHIHVQIYRNAKLKS